jgi:signal transduction histidine kinase
MLRPVLDPPVPAADPAIRRRSRLLAAFLLVLFVVFGAGDAVSLLTIPGYRPPWYGYVILLAAFLLNRGGRYTAAAAVTLAMFPTVLLAVVLSGSRLPALNLVYLAPGVLVASILLSARGTAVFAALCEGTILAVMLLPLPFPLSIREAATPLALVAITAGLSIVAILHRDRVERDRQAERESLIHELEAKNAELERFTYTVSHDLKSPLVTIRGFLALIDRDVAEGRTDRVRGDLQRVRSAA